MNISGKIVVVKLDADKEKKDGGTYKAHVVMLDTSKGFQEVAIPVGGFSAKGFADKLKNFLVGDVITVVKEKKPNKAGVEYWNVTEIYDGEPKDSPAPIRAYDFPKKTGGYDVAGAIKGNSVTNAVNLIIAEGVDLSSDDNLLRIKGRIIRAAKMMLEVHAELDKPVEANKEVAKPTPTPNDEYEAF